MYVGQSSSSALLPLAPNPLAFEMSGMSSNMTTLGCACIYSERERKADYWLGGLLNAVIKSLGEWLKLLDDWEQIVINVPAEGDPDHQQSQV